MEQLTFVATDFEGPLDLLLFLISKHKLNIMDIEISSLLQQYMLYIEAREKEDLETDSSFIEMAARLVQIKTATLLPKHEDEAKELKSALQMELMEYQACKLAAEMLKNRFEMTYVSKGVYIEADRTFTGKIRLELLVGALGKSMLGVKKKVVSAKKITAILEKRIVSIASRIINLMRKLHIGGRISYDDAFVDARSKSHLIATFLGILDMVKRGKIVVENDEIILMESSGGDFESEMEELSSIDREFAASEKV